jgi:hypothetical protein
MACRCAVAALAIAALADIKVVDLAVITVAALSVASPLVIKVVALARHCSCSQQPQRHKSRN